MPDYSVRLGLDETVGGTNVAHIDMRSGVVRAVGDLDIESADAFVTLGCTAVNQCTRAEIVVDLSECTFLDSSGVGALVTVHNAARDADIKAVRARRIRPDQAGPRGDRPARLLRGVAGVGDGLMRGGDLSVRAKPQAR